MLKMRFLFAALAALMLAVPTVRAANFTELTPDMLTSLATAVGGTNVQRVQENGGHGAVFEVGGRPYIFVLDFCSQTDTSKCIGILMLSAFKTSPRDTVAVFNEFHNAAGYVTAVMIDKDAMAFVRHVISLGGITTENVKANFAVLEAAPELYTAFHQGRTVASIAPQDKALLSQPTATAQHPTRLSPAQLNSILTRARAKLN